MEQVCSAFEPAESGVAGGSAGDEAPPLSSGNYRLPSRSGHHRPQPARSVRPTAVVVSRVSDAVGPIAPHYLAALDGFVSSRLSPLSWPRWRRDIRAEAGGDPHGLPCSCRRDVFPRLRCLGRGLHLWRRGHGSVRACRASLSRPLSSGIGHRAFWPRQQSPAHRLLVFAYADRRNALLRQRGCSPFGLLFYKLALTLDAPLRWFGHAVRYGWRRLRGQPVRAAKSRLILRALGYFLTRGLATLWPV